MLGYEKKRCTLYEPFKPFWYNIGDNPYALYDCLAVTPEYISSMRAAANHIIRVYHKTAWLLQHMRGDTFKQLGFPQATFPFLTHQALSVASIIQRLDMVYDGREWKHYEINSDTPTFIMECYEINDLVAEHFGYTGINHSTKQCLVDLVSQAMIQSLEGCGFSTIKQAKIVFTAHQESVEDWETTCYLAGLLKDIFQIELLPLSDLRIVANEGLYTKDGQRIHLLYRQTYPLECLIEDYDEQTGEAIGYELLHLVRLGKLALCNPISAFLLQSKAVQALIWGLHEMGHDCYTPEEYAWIATHFLPTYLDADRFVEQGIPYVEKPVFGREGNTVRIIGAEEKQIYQNDTHYDTQIKVYQEYLGLPKETIHTSEGEMDAHILFGCFVIGDVVGAVGARAGNPITGNESYFLPIGMKGRIK